MLTMHRCYKLSVSRLLTLCAAIGLSTSAMGGFGWDDDLDGSSSSFDWDNPVSLITANGPDQFDQRQIMGTSCKASESASPLDCFALVLRVDARYLNQEQALAEGESANALPALGLVGLLDSEVFLGEQLGSYKKALTKLLRSCNKGLEKRLFKGWSSKNPACFVQVVTGDTEDLYFQFDGYTSAVAVDVAGLELSNTDNDLSFRKNEDKKLVELSVGQLDINANLKNAKYFIGKHIGGTSQWLDFQSPDLKLATTKRFSSVRFKLHWQNLLSEIKDLKLPDAGETINSFKTMVQNTFSGPNIASHAVAAVSLGGYVVDSVCGDNKERCGYSQSSELVKSLERSDRIYDGVIESLSSEVVRTIYADPANQDDFETAFQL